MPLHVPLRKPRPLPAVGQAIERPVMDWKGRQATSVAFEKAKDVAAFANHLGGAILHGADEHNGRLANYRGLSLKDAGDLTAAYSRAVRDLCQPHPMIDFEEYEDPSDPTKRIVVINVDPSLNLVGVKITGNGTKQTGGYGGDAYVYPVRSGIDADYLEPGQLAMFMTPQIRRVAVMLARIPPKQRITVTWKLGRAPPSYEFVGVEEENNLVKLQPLTPAGAKVIHVPLDRVETVYLDEDGNWRMLLDKYT